MNLKKIIFFTSLPFVVGTTAAVSIACANPLNKTNQEKLNSIIEALSGKTIDLKTQTELNEFINNISDLNSETVDQKVDKLFGSVVSATIGKFASIQKLNFDKDTKKLTVTIKYNDVNETKVVSFVVGNLVDSKSKFKVDIATIANLISNKTYNPVSKYDTLDLNGWNLLAINLTLNNKTNTIKSWFETQFSQDLGEANIESIIFTQPIANSVTLDVNIKIVDDIRQTEDVIFKLNLPNQIKLETTEALEAENQKLLPENRITNTPNFLPSEQEITSFEQLMTSVEPELSLIVDNSITYSLLKVIDNDENGTKSVTIRLTKGGINKDLTWLITGYSTTTFINTKAINDEIVKFDSLTKETNDSNLLPSQAQIDSFTTLNKFLKSPYKFNINTDVTYLFKVKDEDQKGTKVVEITLSKGEISAKIDVVISGFLTTSKLAQSYLEAELLKLKIDENQKATDSNKLPSEVLITDFDSLNLAISAPYSYKQASDIKYTFKSEGDDKLGTKTVTISLMKDGVVKEITITISGFLTTAKATQNYLETEVVKLKADNKKAKDSSKFPSEITITNLALLNLAISNPYSYKQASDITYTFKSKDDDQLGTKTVTITLTKNRISKEVTIVISGFKSKVFVEAEAAKDRQDAIDVQAFVNYLGTSGITKSKTRQPNASTDYKDVTTFLENINKTYNTNGFNVTFSNFVNDKAEGAKTFDITITKGKTIKIVNFVVSEFSTELYKFAKVFDKPLAYTDAVIKADTNIKRVELLSHLANIRSNNSSDLDFFFWKLFNVFRVDLIIFEYKEFFKNYLLDLSKPVAISNSFDNKTGKVTPSVKFTIVSKSNSADKEEIEIKTDNLKQDLVGKEYLFWNTKSVLKVKDNIWQVVLVDVDGNELTKSQVALLAQYVGNNYWAKLPINGYSFGMASVITQAIPNGNNVKKVYLYDVNAVKDSVPNLSKINNTYIEYNPADGYVGGVAKSVRTRANDFKTFYDYTTLLNEASTTKNEEQFSGAFLLLADKAITGANAYNGTNPIVPSMK